jgi:Flp pilus assembly protein TadG
MRFSFRKGLRSRRAVAAMEFALVAPLLAMLLGGTVDFAMLNNGRGQLAIAVSSGAAYAFLNSTTVTAASMKTMVENTSFLPTGTVVATVTGPACYCVTSAVMPASTVTCGSTCSGGTTGNYMIISATYTYTPVMPYFSSLATTLLTENATAPLQ